MKHVICLSCNELFMKCRKTVPLTLFVRLAEEKRSCEETFFTVPFSDSGLTAALRHPRQVPVIA
ncbi:hypothetical protein, partial [Stomatobaculum longum]|uniref:hypothetical protein n=1 Tax=Stomatobaculum longum TaxID=796942 RepID=UPI0028062251